MKKGYFMGTIGALIGAILFSLPWILIYVYGNLLLSILAAVVAFGSFKFYKLFGGKVTKKTWLIVAISSVVAITVATFVIIPFWLVAKEGQGFSTFYFEYLYTSGEFVSAIIRDYIISLVFTILGISGVVANIKKEGYTEEIAVNGQLEQPIDMGGKTFEEQVKYLEGIYAKYNAFSKETAVSEFKIMKEINAVNKLAFMMQMEKKGIVVAPFVKSYFDKEAVTNPEKGKKNYKRNIVISIVLGLLIGLIICVAVFGIVFFALDSDASTSSGSNNNVNEQEKVKKQVYTFKDISITLPNSYKELPDESSPREDQKYFYSFSDDIIAQVVLQQQEAKMDLEYEQLYYDTFASALEEEFNIKEKTQITVNGYKGLALMMEYKADTDQYYYVYCTLDSDGLYVVMFYTSVKDLLSPDSKLSEFKSIANSYLDTFEIKKANANEA